MLTLKSNKQAEKLIHDGVLAVDDDIEIAFDGFEVEADIKCRNIYSKGGRRNITAISIIAWNIKARDIKAEKIDAQNIYAEDINARDIDVVDIKAQNIDAISIIAWNIKARDIKAWDITAEDISAEDIFAVAIFAVAINAKDIDYSAICFAYNNIVCRKITGRRENSKHFCLDGEIIIESPENKGQQS